MSKPYAEVIGDPIAQSKSPAIHNFWLGKLGIDAEYRACHVVPEKLEGYFARRREDTEWLGCNVTMPHKQAVMPLLDRLDLLARRIGAVNTVVRSSEGTLTGYNTDAPGFLEPFGGTVPRRVAVVGAGGASRAVLAVLAEQGVERVILQNRNVEKGWALLAEFGLKGDVTEPGEPFEPVDLLVNTSSLGMAGFPPFPELECNVAESGFVYDIVTTPLDTELLARARARGLRTIDGLAMLIGQAAVAFEKFFGQPAPRQHDTELRELLTR